MSAAEALKAAHAAGIHFGIDGDDLLLEALAPPPPAVIDLLSRYKAEIVAQLRPNKRGWSPEDWQTFFEERAGIAEFDGGLRRLEAEAQAFECCITQWLNHYPAPSAAGRCAWCGQAETQAAVVLPYGIDPGTHTWLHAECWRSWQANRRSTAIEALALMIGTVIDVAAATSSSSSIKMNASQLSPFNGAG
jgi:hypothetical protein